MRTTTLIRRSSDGTIIPNKINEESIIKMMRFDSDYGNDKVSTPCFKLYYFSFFHFLFILRRLIENDRKLFSEVTHFILLSSHCTLVVGYCERLVHGIEHAAPRLFKCISTENHVFGLFLLRIGLKLDEAIGIILLEVVLEVLGDIAFDLPEI